MSAFVIKLLQVCPTTQGVCNLTGLSWSTVNAIVVSAVQRGMLGRTEDEIVYLGIDEKSSQKGHSYATILTDIDRSRVVSGRGSKAILMDAVLRRSRCEP